MKSRFVKPSMDPRRPAELSLLEVLTVVAIIAVLAALLFPMFQSSREAARRVACANNLKQIGVACQTHASIHGHFLTGGWSWGWVGDPDKGFGPEQPGGWAYNILPYLERADVRSLGTGVSNPVLPWPFVTSDAMKDAGAQQVSTPVPLFNCPSRRGGLFPMNNTGDPVGGHKLNANYTPLVVRGDYAINCGDQAAMQPDWYMPIYWNDGLTRPDSWWSGIPPRVYPNYTGMSFTRSMIAAQAVRDGLGAVYLVGERTIDPDHYTTGKGSGDDGILYTGMEDDNFRSAFYAPIRDRRGTTGMGFGSAHLESFFMLFGDGAVRAIAYGIDPTTHRRLGHRRDGEEVDPGSL